MASSLSDYFKNFSVENLGSLPSKEVFPLCSWGSGAWAGAGRIVPQTLSLDIDADPVGLGGQVEVDVAVEEGDVMLD